MNNLTTWDYVAGGGGLLLLYVGSKHSGWYKYATWGAAAWLLYGVYQDYSASAKAGA